MSFPSFYLIRIGGIETSASIGIHAFELAARQPLLVSVTLMLKPPPGADTIAYRIMTSCGRASSPW